jgi:hypothetical protein
MTIKELFDKATGPIDYSTFEKLMNESGAKFADLSEGKYVSKDKFDNEVAGKDAQIKTLNDTIKERDKDLKNLNTQLKEAGTDSEKLAELQTQFGNLQTQYKTDTDNYKAQLGKQAYEFAVKEFASGKKFTSNAAKRDFVSSMIAKELKMDGDKILGAEDFVTAYSNENADAFVVEKPEQSQPQTPPPTFSKTVNPNTQVPQQTNDNPFGFHFSQVRPKPNN